MSTIQCRGGVDRATDQPGRSPGSLRDCLNYEVATQQGYRTVDGFVRWDGRGFPGLSNPYRLTLDPDDFDQEQYIVGEYLVSNGKRVALIMDIETEMNGSLTAWALVVSLLASVPAQAVGEVSGVEATVTNSAAITFATAGDLVDEQERLEGVYRDAVTSLPGPVLGEHEFRDHLWAIADAGFTITVSDFPALNDPNQQNLDDPELFVGQEVLIQQTEGGSSPNTYRAEIVGYEILSGDFSEGTATVRYDLLLKNHEIPEETDLLNPGIGIPQEGEYEISMWPIVQMEYSNFVAVNGDQGPRPGELYTTINMGMGRFLLIVEASPSSATSGVALVAQIPTQLPSYTSVENLPNWELSFTPYGSFSEKDMDADSYTGEIRPYISGASDNPVAVGSGTNTAIIFKDNFAGWSPVDMGWEIPFKDGETLAQTIYDATIQALDFSQENAEAGDWLAAGAAESLNDGQGLWTANAGTVVEAIAESDADYARQDTPLFQIGRTLRLSEFAAQVTDLQVVKGIEVEVRVRRDGDLCGWQACRLQLPNGVQSANRAPVGQTLSTSYQTFTFGGQNDNWGLQVNPSRVRDDQFRLRLQFRDQRDDSLDPQPEVQIDRVRLRFWLAPSAPRIYFRTGGADVAEGDLVFYNLTSGSFTGNDAGGILTVRDLTGDLTALIEGVDVFTGAGGTGNFLWKLAGTPERNTLPGKALLDAENSKYLMITENFYAPDRLRAVYGVSGAGPAFVFSDEYFFKIRTGLEDPDEETPRHVANNLGRLLLGFGTGRLAVSVRDVPANFNGVEGAAEVYFGQGITNLLNLQGEATLVSTDSRIEIVQGANPATWIRQHLSTESGAMEYTAVDMGVPVYADIRGLSTIQATERYGDHQRGRLSYAVEPWLTPRLLGRQARPVMAVPVRSKSQYLLFFADGYVLSMTMLSESQPPEILFRRYLLDGEPAVIQAASHETETNRDDRVFVAFEGQPLAYRLDSGRTFDGADYERFLEFNTTYFDPKRGWRANILHYHGLVDQAAELSVRTVQDHTRERDHDRARLRRTTESALSDPIQIMAKSRVNARAEAIALRLEANGFQMSHTLTAYEWVGASPRKVDR